MSKVYYKDSPIILQTLSADTRANDNGWFQVTYDISTIGTQIYESNNQDIYYYYLLNNPIPLSELDNRSINYTIKVLFNTDPNDTPITYNNTNQIIYNSTAQTVLCPIAPAVNVLSTLYLSPIINNNNMVGIGIWTTSDNALSNEIDTFWDFWIKQISYPEQLYQLTADIVGAAPALHSHNASSIGMIPMSKGGLQNNLTASLSSFIGPLRTNSVNSIINLHSQDFTTTGVYYATSSNDTSVSVGTAGWAQGAIPYNTREDQIKALYKTVNLGDTIFLENILCAGVMFSNGKTVVVPVNIYYQIPAGTTSVTLAGTYIIRVNGYYMFTSGTNYATSSSGVKFSEKPSYISDAQTITMNTASNLADGTGWAAIGASESWYQPILRLRRDSQTAQTTAYSYASTYGGTTSSCVGKGWGPALVHFYNLEITFNGS